MGALDVVGDGVEFAFGEECALGDALGFDEGGVGY